MKKHYRCSICGYSEHNRSDWCDLGCGRDYNEMIEVLEPLEEKKCTCQNEEGHSPECPLYVENTFWETPTTDWKERFDKQISDAKNIYYGNDGYDKLGEFLESNKNKLFRVEQYPETAYELDPEKVADFIQSEIDKARRGERKKMVEELSNKKCHDANVNRATLFVNKK